jgi:hypothetical protein
MLDLTELIKKMLEINFNKYSEQLDPWLTLRNYWQRVM